MVSSAAGLVWHTIPQGIAGILFGFAGGYLVRRANPRLVLILSACLYTVGTVTVAFVNPGGMWAVQAIAFAIGAATALFISGTQNLIVEAVPADSQGASGH